MLASVPGITEANKRRYNLDDDFLLKHVQIVIGVLDCQVETVSMQGEGLKNSFLHPQLQLLQPKAGLNMLFKGALAPLKMIFCALYLNSDQVLIWN